MTALHVLWNGWCAIPYGWQVVIVAVVWLAVTIGITTLGRAAKVGDELLDADRERENVRAAMVKPLPRDRHRLGTVR